MLALRHIVAAWLVHGPAMAAGFSSRSAQAVPTARAFWRLPLGRIEAVVVFKRSILSGNPRRTFQAPPEEIRRTLESASLPNNRSVFGQNVPVLNRASHLTVFETGSGPSQAFEPDADRLPANLAMAGLTTAEGAPALPNVRLAVEWTARDG